METKTIQLKPYSTIKNYLQKDSMFFSNKKTYKILDLKKVNNEVGEMLVEETNAYYDAAKRVQKMKKAKE